MRLVVEKYQKSGTSMLIFVPFDKDNQGSMYDPLRKTQKKVALIPNKDSPISSIILVVDVIRTIFLAHLEPIWVVGVPTHKQKENKMVEKKISPAIRQCDL
jgi:hypothetical protein